jgi:hypothetical protein
MTREVGVRILEGDTNKYPPLSLKEYGARRRLAQKVAAAKEADSASRRHSA